MTKEKAIEILEQREHCAECVTDCTCDECEEAFDMAIRALKNEQTDGDLISRTDLIEYINNWFEKEKYYHPYAQGKTIPTDELMDLIEQIPSAEKTAEWIKQKSGDELFPEEIVCSKCYHSNSHLDFDEHNNPIGKVFLESKYCPNCGARMGVGE